MLTPQSDAGCAGIARARRRGLLGKFGGRGGVRRRGCGSANSRCAWGGRLERTHLPLVMKPRKKEFFETGAQRCRQSRASSPEG